MPKINFENIGDVLDYDYLRGVIQSVDSSDDTCTVTINGSSHYKVPIYYHCTPASTLRDNGAIEGAAAGFAEEDEVIVQKQRSSPYRKSSDDVVRVIGHIDGIRSCDSGFVLVVASQSGDEAVAWDIATNSILVSKASLSSVESSLSSMGFSSTVQAQPSDSQNDSWDWSTDPAHDAVKNLPILVNGLVSGDGLKEIFTPVWPYEYTGSFDYTFYYLENPLDNSLPDKGSYIIYLYGEAEDSEETDFETLTGVSWPTSGANPQRQYLYFHSMFGSPMDGVQAILSNLEPAMTQIFDSWSDADWAAYNDVSSTDAWIDQGIASTSAGYLLFEYAGVCSDVSEATDECNDYANHYENIFRIYHHQLNQVAWVSLTILEAVNQERTDAGLGGLTVNANLQAAAEEQAQYMADNTIVTHAGDGGSTAEERILAENFLLWHDSTMLSSAYAENVAAADLTQGAGDCSVTLDDRTETVSTDGCTAQSIINAWMASAGHEANILHSDFNETGVAAIVGSDGKTYVCQTFGYRESAWPGFAQMEMTDLESYIDSNFNFDGMGDETRVPKIYLA